MPAPDEVELLGGSPGEVQDPALREWAPVHHPHLHGSPVRLIRDAKEGAERKMAVRSDHALEASPIGVAALARPAATPTDTTITAVIPCFALTMG